jgi:hypothetical protein
VSSYGTVGTYTDSQLVKQPSSDDAQDEDVIRVHRRSHSNSLSIVVSAAGTGTGAGVGANGDVSDTASTCSNTSNGTGNQRAGTGGSQKGAGESHTLGDNSTHGPVVSASQGSSISGTTTIATATSSNSLHNYSSGKGSLLAKSLSIVTSANDGGSLPPSPKSQSGTGGGGGGSCSSGVPGPPMSSPAFAPGSSAPSPGLYARKQMAPQDYSNLHRMIAEALPESFSDEDSDGGGASDDDDPWPHLGPGGHHGQLARIPVSPAAAAALRVAQMKGLPPIDTSSTATAAPTAIATAGGSNSAAARRSPKSTHSDSPSSSRGSSPINGTTGGVGSGGGSGGGAGAMHHRGSGSTGNSGTGRSSGSGSMWGLGGSSISSSASTSSGSGNGCGPGEGGASSASVGSAPSQLPPLPSPKSAQHHHHHAHHHHHNHNQQQQQQTSAASAQQQKEQTSASPQQQQQQQQQTFVSRLFGSWRSTPRTSITTVHEAEDEGSSAEEDVGPMNGSKRGGK